MTIVEPRTVRFGRDDAWLAIADVHAGRSTRSRLGELEAIHALLVLPRLRAETLVEMGPPAVGASLDELFLAMAARWRGWTGAMEWSSSEGGLSLSGSHDRLGHVTLGVELRQDPQPGWLARGDVMLDAGALEALADDVRRFVRADAA